MKEALRLKFATGQASDLDFSGCNVALRTGIAAFHDGGEGGRSGHGLQCSTCFEAERPSSSFRAADSGPKGQKQEMYIVAAPELPYAIINFISHGGYRLLYRWSSGLVLLTWAECKLRVVDTVTCTFLGRAMVVGSWSPEGIQEKEGGWS